MLESSFRSPNILVSTSGDLSVRRIADYDFTGLYDLPYAQGNAFDALVTRRVDRASGKGPWYYRTDATGRGGGLAPHAVFTYHGEHPCIFTNVYLKGNGIFSPDSAAASYGVGAAWFSKEWSRRGKPSYMPGYQEIVGAAQIQDTLLDAHQSMRAHIRGVRVRLPIAVYLVDTMPIEGQWYSHIDQRWMDLPYAVDDAKQASIAAFARRFPLTIDDCIEYINAHEEGHARKTAADEVVRLFMSHLRYSEDAYIHQLSSHYLESLSQGCQIDELRAMESDAYVWIARTLAAQMQIWRKERIIHSNISRHNLTPVVEFQDNSHLEIGEEEHGRDREDFERYHNANRYSAIEYVNSWLSAICTGRGEIHSISDIGARVKAYYWSILTPNFSTLKNRWTYR